VASDDHVQSSAPHFRQITMPELHHSIFYRPDALPDVEPTVSSKHWKQLFHYFLIQSSSRTAGSTYKYYLQITHLHFNGHFPGEPSLAGCTRVFYLHLLQKWVFGEQQHSYFYGLDTLSVAQPTVSKRWRENSKHRTPTSGLTSSTTRLQSEGELVPLCRPSVTST